MGLNHIYKVIWSKTKNAWVVVSEIAKRDGKSSVKSVVTSLAGKSVAAVMVAMVMCGGVASANTVYGPGAIVNGSNSTAIGDNANIDNLSKDSVAIGPNASIINGTDSVTIGSSSSSKKFGIAIGGAAKSSDTGAIAIGRNTNSKKEDSITIGNYANNDGGSIVIGKGSTINNYDPSRTSRSGILIGDNSKSIDVGSIGIGNQVSIGSTSASSHSSYAIAIGDAARVEGDNSIVIGHAANSALQANRAIAIGAGARSDGSHSIALGSAIVNHDNAIAIGKQTMTSGDGSIAIGHAATIKENYITPSSNSIALGQEVSVDGATSIAMGYGVRVDANRTVAIGSNNRRSNVLPYDWMPIVASDSVVLGYNHQLDNSSSSKITTLGYHNTVDASRTIVIGNEIVVANDLEGAVVLGDSSEASPYVRANDVTISGMTIQSNSFAGNSGSKGSILSIGSSSNNRQIKNVAAGVISSTSTDAINGSQLYEAVRAVTAGASPDVYMHVNDGTSTQGAGGGNNLGKANEKSGALGNYSIAVGRNAQSKGTNSISIGYQSGTTNDQSIAIGGNAHVNSSHSIAIGDNANASGTYSIAMGASSVNGDKNLALNNSYVYSGNDSVAINGSLVAGNNNIAIGGAYIGAGRTYSRDASGNPTSNIGNMQTAAPTLGVSNMQGEQYLEPVKNSIAIGNNAYVTRSNTIVMGDKTFDNIKSSKTATDFIAPTKSKFSSVFSGDINLYHEGTLGNSVYLGHDSYAFTPDALTDGESSSSGENSIHTKKYDSTGNIVVSNNTTGGAFGKVSKATINGDEITGFAGTQAVGAVTIGAGDYERRIQNVAAGEVSATSTDGINGSQLYAVADTLSKNMSSYMHINDGTGTQAVGNATTNYGYSGSKAGATGTKAIAGGVNAQATRDNGIALGADALSSGRGAITIGHSARNESDYNITIGESSTIDNNSIDSIAMGRNSTITDSIRSITIGLDNSMTKSASVTGTLEGGIAIGTKNKLLDSSAALSLGTGNKITNSGEALVIGNGGEAKDSKASIVMGVGAKAENALIGVAIGSGAQALNKRTVAIGAGAKAEGEQSISIGTGNEVKGNKSSAIGDPSYIDTTATGTHVHGNDNGTATNPIKASESTFMGNTNLAGTAGTTGIHVVGNSNTVDSSNVMVMGNGVTVGTGLDGAVVLGNASSADQYAAATDSTINGVTFEAAGYAGNTGLNNGSIVSVGATGTERQIKNVAAGAVTATSTDAINGSQLYKTAETILKMPINMAGDSGDTVGLKLGKTVNIKGSVASGADVTDGNIAVVGDKATSTLSLKMAKNLTGLTSGTFTDATGNQTVINGAGVTVTPTGTGATPISITTSGINAGNQEIKGVKKGTTDDAAVNKKQMDDALAGISSTLTINDGTTDGSVNIKTGKLKVVGESGANALVTTTVSGDTITVGTSTKLQNAVTAAEKSADKDLSNLSTTGSDKVKTLAQDAVKVAGTGLATVSDATAAGVKTYTVNVDEGKLVIDDTTGKVGAAGSTQGTTAGKDGVATTQNVASVVNAAIDKTTQALADAEHKFDGDTGTTSVRKHGEVLSIKGGVATSADLTTGNIGVVSDGAGTLNIRLAKVLTGLTSATYTDAAGNTQTVTGGSSTISDAAGNSTVVSKGGVTTTDAAGNTTTTVPTGVTVTPAGAGATPISVTTSGISAGNKEIKNVANGTTDDAAVNKKQMDDALKGATDNTVSLGSESGSTTAKKLSTTGGIKFNIKGETGANALITTSATGDDVTVAPTAKLTAAVTAAENAANKDLSNLTAAGDTYIKNLAKAAASWNVETNGAGTTAVAGGETVNFINGDNIAITNTGRSITIGTAKNVSFDKVTVGGIVLDKTDGINAGGKEIKGVATGTAADSAVNKAQMDAAITAAAGGSLSTEKVVAKTLTGDNNLATVAGQTGTAKGETYEVSVSENAVKAVAATAAQDAVKVAGTGLATVSDATAAGVKTYTVNVDEGKLVIDDTTGKVGAAGSTQGTTAGKDGVATTQNVASVVNAAIDKTTQALADAEHKFDGDTGTTSVRKHGEVLSIKGGVATSADLTTGNIGVVSDGAGTLNIRLAKVLTGLTSASFTTTGGDTTVINGGGVTITPSGTGASAISMTTNGINAGGKEIKGVANATSADAAVNKGQLDAAVLAAAGGALSIEKVEAGSTANGKLAAGDTNLATVSGLTGTSQNETYAVTVSENAVKAVAATAAQDAVKVAGTGLATVSDATAAGVKTYTVNVDEGKLVIDDTTGKVGAAGSTQGTTAGKDGVATTQNVASVVNAAIDKTTQALADAKHDFAGDDSTVISRKHGEQLNIKGGASTTATDLTSGNIAVVGDTTSGTLNIKLAKVLTGLTSATYTDAAGNTQTVTGGSSTISDAAGNSTVVSKGGVTTTDAAGNTTTTVPTGVTVTPAGAGATPISVTTSGISAGNKEIKNVANGTTDDAAVNKKQMDDALKGATDNTVSLGSESGSTTAKKLSTTGGIKFNIKGETGANALITTSATGDDVTVAPTAKLTAAVTAAENAANKDLSNLTAAGDTYIKNLAKAAASWNVETNGAGTTAVAGGETVNFINGDNISITNTGRSITIGTAKNVAFDKVTVGGVVIDKTDGINAGSKEIKGIATGTTNDAAVNKGQLDAAIATVSSGASSTEKVVAKTLTGDTNLATVTGQTGTAKGETYEVSVSENAVKAVAATAAQDAVKVAGTGLATVSDATAAGVKTYTVNVDEGKLVIDDTTGKVGAAGSTQGTTAGKDGVATTQNVASVVNAAIDKTTQALADAEHKFDGDTGTTSVRKHGEVLSIKGGVATSADLTTGNIGVVSDGAGTLNIRLAKVLSGLTSATFTSSTGTTVINGDGLTVTPSAAGTNPISITTGGINAGNTEIRGVAAATHGDAAVNKAQMDTAIANAASVASSTEKVIAKTLIGDTNLVTVTNQTGTPQGETYEVAVSENAIKAAAQDAVKVAGTGLATVSDATAAGVKTYTVNVDEGKLVIDDTTGKVGAAGSTQGTTAGKDGVATTQNVASVVNAAIDKTTQALADAEHKFDGDTGTTSVRKHGEVLSIKGGVATSADLTTGNIGVVSDGAGTLNIRLAKVLTGLTSATYTDAAGNTQTVTGGSSTISDAAGNSTVVSKGGVTTTDAAGNTTTTVPTGVTVTPAGAGATPISVTTSGISAGNKEIKNVANGTTDDAAVNKKQMDDALKGATDNTVSLGSESGSTTAKKLSTTGGIKFNIKGETGANALITTSATGDDVTVAPTAKLTAAVTAAENAANKDLSNLTAAGDTYIKNLAKAAASWNVETNGAGTTAVAGGETVNFINGDNIAITNTGRSITIGTAKNVSFDKVTVGGIVLDKTDGINAGNKEIKGIATGTTNDAAVNKGQLDAAIATVSSGASSTEKVVAKTLTGDTNLATVTGQTGTAKGETYEVSVSENAVKAVAATAAQDAVKVAGTGLATVSDATAAGVKTYTVNVDEGKLVIDDTTGKVGAAGSTQGTTAGKDGVATTQNVASVVNAAIDKTTQALADAKHDFAGDDSTVISRKHGEKLNIKGGASTTAADLTAGNIAVLGDAATGTLNIRMAKALTGLSSATFTTPSGTTVINGGGMTITPSTTGAAPISITTGGINAGNTEIKNVAAGTTATSAVNKQQMDNAISNATANVGFNTAGNTGTGSVSNGQTLTITGTNGIETNASGQSITVGLDAATRAQINNATTTANNAAKKDLSNIDNAGKQVIKDTAAWNVKVNGAAAETVKGGDTVTFNDGDNIKVTNTGKDITIATKKDVSFDKVTVGNVVIDKNTNRISGLANAANNDEAVNLGQMNAAISTATAGIGNIKYKANGGTQNSVALTTGFDFKGDSNIQITADPANSGVINYKLNPALTGITSISGGTGAPTITLNAGSGSNPGNVSINSNLDMGGKQINNIGAATHAGDAVNKAQMDQALQNIAGASSNVAKSYAYKAGAGAAALAALKPIQYDPLEPTQIMAGIGNYKSQTAVALGVAHYTNENTMFNLGVSLDSHDGIVNAGVTHKFGYSPEKKAIPDKYKGGPISSIYVMQDEVTALQAIVQKQAAENEALRQQNEDMQRKVDMILSKIH